MHGSITAYSFWSAAAKLIDRMDRDLFSVVSAVEKGWWQDDRRRTWNQAKSWKLTERWTHRISYRTVPRYNIILAFVSSIMFGSFLISALALLGSVIQVSSNSPSWTIYHSWNLDQEFSKRGELTWSEEEAALQITNDESSITQESIQAMLDYGWYHVKIENNNAAEDDFVLSTVPACSIRRANFKDEFQVTLPRTQEAQITSLAYLPLASPLAPKSCEELDALTAPATFTSKVSLTLDTPGMILKAVL